MQQGHHVAAEILNGRDKIIEDAHDARETVDGGERIEVSGDGGVAPDHLANIERKRVLQLGDDRRRAARGVGMGLSGHEGGGLPDHEGDRLEIGPLPIGRPFVLGDGIRLPGDDEVQRIGPHVAPGLCGSVQETLGVRSRGGEVVVANNELVVPIGGAE